MSADLDRGLRARLAREAARLMYEEGVKQYFTAKRVAARRLLGRVGGRRIRYRPSDLPSNGEIRDALLAIAEMAEGERRTQRLFAMRAVALEAMRAMAPFSPRLIGSVGSGHIRQGSDIDLHVFTDDPDALWAHLRALGWRFETESVSIFKGGAVRDYLHAHVTDVFEVELTVHTVAEMRVRPRSSTDGKPIERLSARAVEDLMAREHPQSWAKYQCDGTIDGLDMEALDEGDGDERAAPEVDAFGSFLRDAVDPERLAALLGHGAAHDDDEDYAPLPGFDDAAPDRG